MKDFDTEIAALKEQQQPLFKEREALDKKIIRISKKIEKLREQKEKEQLMQPLTPEQEMEYFLFEDGGVSGERYKARQKYWEDRGFGQSGYFHDIQQINLKMMLRKGKNDNLEQTISTLEKVIPLLKPLKGVKHLDIFEHTCSENGCWSVEITEASYDLILYRYHRRSVEKSFDNLRSLVEYVQEHHYYESDEEDD